MIRSLLLLSILLLPFSGRGATLETSFLTLTLPAYWQCHLTGSDWLCKDQRAVQSNYALLTVSAKEAAPEDTLTSLKKRLFAPILRRARAQDVGEMSNVVKAEQEVISGQPWIYAEHYGSVIAHYYTFYLATMKNSLAILLNFSVHRSYVKAYEPFILQTFNSIHLKAWQAPTASSPALAAASSPGLKSPTSTAPNEMRQDALTLRRTWMSKWFPYMIFAAFAFVSVLFVWMFARRK